MQGASWRLSPSMLSLIITYAAFTYRCSCPEIGVIYLQLEETELVFGCLPL